MGETDQVLYTNSQEVRSEFVNHYSNLYRQDPVNQEGVLNQWKNRELYRQASEVQRQELNSEIEMGELIKTIREGKDNKAAGPDGLPAEIYKCLIEELSPVMLDLFHKIYKGETQLPPSWAEANISLIAKPGKDVRRCDSYRPISLLNADYKIFTRLLAKRLAKIAPSIIHLDQKGFMPGRHLYELTHDLIGTIDMAIGKNLPLAIVTMDASNAFDKVNWLFLFAVLEANHLGGNFINALRLIY